MKSNNFYGLPNEAQRLHESKLDQLATISILSVLVREAAGAAIRYYASSIGLGVVWFLPDVLVGMALVGLCIRMTTEEPRRFFMLIGITLLALVIGSFVSRSLLAPVSALKMFSITFVAAHVNPRRWSQRTISLFFAFVLSLAIVGVMLNSSSEFPWAGAAYESFGIEREFSRTWYIDGEPRLAGFGSVSASTAFAILSLTILLSPKLSVSVFAVVCGFSYAAISLTTTRTAIYALIFISAFLIIIDILPIMRYKRLMLLCTFARLCVVVCVVISFVSIWYFSIVEINLNNAGAFASFVDRAQNTWGGVFSNIANLFPFGLITGMGFGTIGYPMKLYGDLGQFYNSADNVFLVFYSTFGLYGLFLFVKAIQKCTPVVPLESTLSLVLCSVFGATIAGLGDSWFMAVLGIAFSPLVMGVRTAVQSRFPATA